MYVHLYLPYSHPPVPFLARALTGACCFPSLSPCIPIWHGIKAEVICTALAAEVKHTV